MTISSRNFYAETRERSQEKSKKTLQKGKKMGNGRRDHTLARLHFSCLLCRPHPHFRTRKDGMVIIWIISVPLPKVSHRVSLLFLLFIIN